MGTVAVDNPWELLHKIRVGQPGSAPTMPSWVATGGTPQGAADIGRYIQDNFPTGIERVAGTLVLSKGVAKRSKRGTWNVKATGTYDPGLPESYAGDLRDLRVTIEGLPQFDPTASGGTLKAKRDKEKTRAVVKFTIKPGGGNKLAVSLKKRRLLLVLRNASPSWFDPRDGVSVEVDLANSRASVTSPMTFRGDNKAVFGGAGR